MTSGAAWGAWAVVALWLVACGGPQKTDPGSDVDESDAVVTIACDVADAEVWVNERRVGFVTDLDGGIALSPGKHRLEVRHDRYHTHYEMLELVAEQRATVSVELAEMLD